MTTTYDVIPPTHAWIEDGEVATGDLLAFDRAFDDPHKAVKGLWRLTVLTEDGDDIAPVLVAVTR